jgi:cell pole-organizing protein PopZ
MEEILASIRRIISEDDAPAGEGEAPAAEAAPGIEPMAAPEPEPAPLAPAPHVEAEAEDDVLELTERVEAPVETLGDLDIQPMAEPEPPPAPEPEPVVAARAPEPRAAPAQDNLVSDPAAEAAASAFGRLSATIAMPSEGRTLEDVVRELLRPMLKAWLDENLPGIVQATVDQEVDRIARSRVR